jgi:hypothetical protein
MKPSQDEPKCEGLEGLLTFERPLIRNIMQHARQRNVNPYELIQEHAKYWRRDYCSHICQYRNNCEVGLYASEHNREGQSQS